MKATESISGARARHLRIMGCLRNQGRIAELLAQRRWTEVAEVAEFVRAGIDPVLAQTDPSLFIGLRSSVTEYCLRGYGLLSVERLRSLDDRDQA